MSKLTVYFPPSFDGELHIEVASLPEDKAFSYMFTHAARGDDWDTLVAVAHAILAQDARRKGRKYADPARQGSQSREGDICTCGHSRMVHVSNCHVTNCYCRKFEYKYD
ncbi:MAG TPA: hypothetical protein VF077_00560 [Nitrospiraceae bacterium]